ncbi:MAG TPA: M67 family metallopeptidase [Gammaproteobacteria bacterium]
MERVELPRTLAIVLLHEAQRSPEKEVCGLIAARNGHATRVIPVRNVAPDPRDRFEMDERELIDAMKTLRENSETLFATWHSHPDSAPELSQLDIERLGYPDALHLVISMETKGVLQMRGWRLNGDAPYAVEVGVRDQE